MPYKRSWDYVRKILKFGGYNVDLRKSSKTFTPMSISADCCDFVLRIKKRKDFPLEDLYCSCGKTLVIKWEDVKKIK